ncbi:uroporphyrinogen decarboxylase family protein [Candidatus Contubernalis alkaliaceticus]|uniref:uroporphyrinogen decarboxylase family protein n=1 Tax=Candidatus Contubernalis alkaliaceticus TaxID=338645 RepID=UPI001F4C4DA9|nr:uroporphyrinogen decarboxylase family protein [Candidatus Contubernalis alkalaceticus]UNC90865.1 hypothetical protein HUE98_01455 [Candidatus Contubernalis alkalaceticus]
MNHTNKSEKKLPGVKNTGFGRVKVVPLGGVFSAAISGLSTREYYLNPEKAFKAQVWAAELIKHDAVPSFSIPDYAGWDFGGELFFPETPPCSLPHLVKRPVNMEEDVYNLQVPDILNTPATGRKLAFARISKKMGYTTSIPGGSPLGIVGSLLGGELMLRWMVKKPELIHQLLRISTDYLYKISEVFISEVGLESCTLASSFPWESNTLCSPHFFEKFSLPYVIELHEHFLKLGMKKWSIHLCGDHRKNLIIWKNSIPLPPKVLFTMGDDMNLEHAAKALGEQHAFGGNISCTLLQTGTPDQVYEKCKDIIKKVGYLPGGFVLMPACTISPLTPPANVYAMVKAAGDLTGQA